jgi:exopolysaccharide biosynthesis polyprenyl glycosylphosphotransferase
MAPAIKLDIGRTWLVFVGSALLFGLIFERWVVRKVFDRMRSRGLLLRRVLVAGLNEEGLLVRQVITSEPRLGYEFVGFVENLVESNPHSDASPLEDPACVLSLAERLGVGSVIVAATAIDVGSSNRLIRSLTEHGVHVEISSTLCDIAASRLAVRPIGRLPVLHIEPILRNGWRARAKRAFDLAGAAVVLTVVSPVIAVAMIAIKLTTAGPVLFRQNRVGLEGQPFEILKLRTMVVDAENRLADLEHLNEADGILFKLKDDPRITRVGRWLRKTSIDELPQLINVIRGEMSLVGPRPALPHESARWSPELHHRVRVRPGITGMWQVSRRGESGGHDTEYTRLDLYYVDNWSLVTDLVILARTLPVVLGRKGQY